MIRKRKKRSSYQHGHIRKRGKRNPVWEGRWWEVVTQADGTEDTQQPSVILGRCRDITKREARVKLDDILRPLNLGLRHAVSVQTFHQYVDGDWKSTIFPTLKHATRRSYRQVLGAHLLPFFGEMRLSDITRVDCQRFVTSKIGQGCSHQTVKNSWSLLSAILRNAMENELVLKNAATGCKFPPKGPAARPVILTPDQIRTLIARAEEPYRTMIFILSVTGLRPGELLALRWGDVDTKNGLLHVRASVSENGEIQTTKTGRERSVPIGPTTCRFLESYRDRSMRIGEDDFLFSNRKGAPLKGNNLQTRKIKPLARLIGLPTLTFQQFRAYVSTQLQDGGASVKVAQVQLGHADPQTTLRHYSAVVSGSHREAIEALETLLCPSVPKLAQTGDVPIN